MEDVLFWKKIEIIHFYGLFIYLNSFLFCVNQCEKACQRMI